MKQIFSNFISYLKWLLWGRKVVVICFDGRTTHGGLADRLKGIITIYSICKRNKIPFYLFFQSPMDIRNWFVPNLYDWSIEKSNITYHPRVSIDLNFIDCSDIDEITNKLYSCYQNNKHKQIHVYCNTHTSDLTFHYLFTELFKIEDSLMTQIDYLNKSLFCGKSYIALSFRFHQLLGDFVDCIGVPLPEQKQEELINKCLNKIKCMHDELYPEKLFLITGDSTKFVNRAKSLPFVRIIEGRSVHMDKVHMEPTESYTKVFIDLLMLSRAEKAFLLCTGDMYKGGFAKTAALIGHISFDIINF